MPKKSLKGGVWPFDIFSKPKDPQESESAGWFRNPFKKTTPGVEATQVPEPAPAPAPTAVAQQDTPVTGGKRRTKRKSRSNKKNGKSKKRR
jgi:hypothetical protein